VVVNAVRPEVKAPIVEVHERLARTLQLDLLVAREDLGPFPLSGNKVRKLAAELAAADPAAVLLSNGGIDSNHSRTLAILGAQNGAHVHLVLHTEGHHGDISLAMLTALGATVEVVDPTDIASTLDRIESDYARKGVAVHRIAGGCHTPAGARAFRDAGASVITDWQPDVIVHASGTGATQGGLVAAAAVRGVRVIGISVARDVVRGSQAVREAAGWAGCADPAVEFIDDYRDGGYGRHGSRTQAAVAVGWSHGIPLDPTYTGKAFAALLDPEFRDAHLAGKRVLFWHTGGLFNWISSAGTGLRQTEGQEA
jgi:D-cysteine desulfhydrase